MKGESVRVSVSSQPSTSSQGSAQDDYDALGYVFMWGEGIGDGFLGGGMRNLGSAVDKSVDALFPKAVYSRVVLDAQQIACGGKHAAVVTRLGELFSWGEESGGWLGHGVNVDVPYPKLVESLSSHTVDRVACGEYHTCALTQSGDLYTWGNGAHKFGLLGHGQDISHSTPKRICGSIDGLRVSSVSCGPWHTALVTDLGQLFTFGDGTFGVLGHGDRMSISIPKEVESLKGLRTVTVACGVWHTAAVIDVMAGYSSSNNPCSGKLFTWGDGDKGRLGHEDMGQKLVPTCVSTLIDYSFQQVACGHSLTVALSTSGRVFTIGSTAYGQLGEPQADGRRPVRVEGRLSEAIVEEIACGAHHVAVLTSNSEVYTWGKGANGRLGHGDVEDKKSPALVEALKDRQAKSIACGASFTAAICLNKWGAGSEQPSCASCRQPFSFTRKRHKCYNCGIVVCHACSSRKASKALMAPNPNKPYRVCDSCFQKISRMANQMSQAVNSTKKQHQDHSSLERSKPDLRIFPPQPLVILATDGKRLQSTGKKADVSSSRVAPAPIGLLTWGHGLIAPSETAPDSIPRRNESHSRRNLPRRGARSVSPFSRQMSPPRSTTSSSTSRALASTEMIVEDLKRKNEALSQEVYNLRMQIENMSQKHRLRENELQNKLNDAFASITEESERCSAAKEVIKSLTGQLKAFAERLPEEKWIATSSSPRMHPQLLNGVQLPVAQADLGSPKDNDSTVSVGTKTTLKIESMQNNNIDSDAAKQSVIEVNEGNNNGERTVASRITNANGTTLGLKQMEISHLERPDDGKISEWVEQDESGVYITLVSLPTGGRNLKRVRFSKRRFTEKQAELWWAENQARIYKKYNVESIQKTLFESKTGKA